jgi:hypothetical protein
VNILAIDPGATTGWVIYDSEAGRVLAAGHFREHHLDTPRATQGGPIDWCVIERPKGYGPTRPQLVECGIVFGRLVEHLQRLHGPVHEMLRMDICRILSDACHGQIRVRNDATAWAAVLHLHGGPDAAKKGGSLHGVKSHARAALAAAVAACLQRDEQSNLSH